MLNKDFDVLNNWMFGSLNELLNGININSELDLIKMSNGQISEVKNIYDNYNNIVSMKILQVVSKVEEHVLDVEKDYIQLYEIVLSQKKNDAFHMAGSGLGETYKYSFIPLRIDFLFSDKKLKVNNFKAIRKGLSDHYPIISYYGFD